MGFGKMNKRSNWWQKTLTFTTIICMILLTMTLYFTAVSKSFYFPGYLISKIWNYSNSRSDAYEFTGDVRLEESSDTVFIDAPAILFSTAGFALNYFHSVSDVMVPLFATSQRFNRNVIFLVTNHNASRFTSVHRKTIETLSKYEFIPDEVAVTCPLNFNMVMLEDNKANDGGDQPMDSGDHPMESGGDAPQVPVEEKMTDALLDVDIIVKPIYTMLEVMERVDEDSLLFHANGSHLGTITKNRKLTNELEQLKLERKLGFDPTIHDLGDHVEYSAKIVNTFDVMVAVHGSALTNMLFLPENAVVIQIIPWGLDDEGRICFAMR
ncbi:hypothetical protein SASPL_114553 [Salvia splendens]|uniref:Glycosyltransferase 61 catalytic domain-containing protein n=1 Tax=Salvia splendens TaxID=180675 RepID=A0A8X8Y0U9_SALSN|nr:hypothetical protein SASPL_114553 [Salvia splendens]